MIDSTSKFAEDILGFSVSTMDLEQTASSILKVTFQSSRRLRCKWLACINPHSYVSSLDDESFTTALHAADWLVPDGSGIVFSSLVLGGSIRSRVTGSDIFNCVMDGANKFGCGKIFFLGSTEATLAKIKSKVVVDYPLLEVVGTYSPPFSSTYSEIEIDEMVRAINDSSAEILWVGLTAPKQEKWLLENSSRLNVRFAGAIGAVFDFYAENVRRSHPVFQRLHLEWLPRLIQEPRRLWRRMAVSAPLFIWHVLRQRFRFNEKSTP